MRTANATSAAERVLPRRRPRDAGVILSSSLRTTPPAVTLAHARTLARALGITRITDITRLDRVGIPVYASIRPGAVPGSLCVNAGKGLLPLEAEVGAAMEAIEFALAEPGRSPHVKPLERTARDVLDGRTRPDAILDLCPKMSTRVRLDAPMACVEAEEWTTGARALLPAELVFLPFRAGGRHSVFGASSNGLASGNTREEAVLHALCEIVERDVRSFEAVRDTSALVDLDSIAGPPARLVTAVRDAGLELFVRSATNAFGVAYFHAILHDPDATTPSLLNAGYGCHPHRSVALVRAVSEAAQSRLSYIHGGRDDLADHAARYRRWSLDRKQAYVRRVVGRAADRARMVRLEAIADHAGETPTVAACLRFVLGRLDALGMRAAYVVAFTGAADPLQVVRVVVPGAEHFNESLQRVGRRLRDHARA